MLKPVLGLTTCVQMGGIFFNILKNIYLKDLQRSVVGRDREMDDLIPLLNCRWLQWLWLCQIEARLFIQIFYTSART